MPPLMTSEWQNSYVATLPNLSTTGVPGSWNMRDTRAPPGTPSGPPHGLALGVKPCQPPHRPAVQTRRLVSPWPQPGWLLLPPPPTSPCLPPSRHRACHLALAHHAAALPTLSSWTFLLCLLGFCPSPPEGMPQDRGQCLAQCCVMDTPCMRPSFPHDYQRRCRTGLRVERPPSGTRVALPGGGNRCDPWPLSDEEPGIREVKSPATGTPLHVHPAGRGPPSSCHSSPAVSGPGLAGPGTAGSRH